jgi:hypothetical protein
VKVTSPIFKKNLVAEIERYFGQLLTICEGVYIGHFTTKTLIDEYTITLAVIHDNTVKICLSSNEYTLFDAIFTNFKFLLE